MSLKDAEEHGTLAVFMFSSEHSKKQRRATHDRVALFLCALLGHCAVGDVFLVVQDPIIDLDIAYGVFLDPHQLVNIIGPDRAAVFE